MDSTKKFQLMKLIEQEYQMLDELQETQMLLLWFLENMGFNQEKEEVEQILTYLDFNKNF